MSKRRTIAFLSCWGCPRTGLFSRHRRQDRLCDYAWKFKIHPFLDRDGRFGLCKRDMHRCRFVLSFGVGLLLGKERRIRFKNRALCELAHHCTKIGMYVCWLGREAESRYSVLLRVHNGTRATGHRGLSSYYLSSVPYRKVTDL